MHTYSDKPLGTPNDSAKVPNGLNPNLDEIKRFHKSDVQAQHLTSLTRALLQDNLNQTFQEARGKLSPAQIQDCLHYVHWELPGNLVNQFRGK
jgi:hypothetical protein